MNPTGFADQVASVSLPPGWAWARLADIARINPALDVRITDDARMVTFVPMAAVDEGFGGVQRPQVRTFGEVKKGYTPFQVNDVIMAKITPCMENGKGGVVRGKPEEIFFGSTEFHVLRVRDGILPEWVGAFLAQERLRRAARLGMKGSAGQLRVPEEFLERLYFPLPPSSEQSRIADRIDEMFTDLAAGVAALERVRRNLSRYRAAVLHAAVTGRLTEAWRKQHGPPEESGPELLKRILIERRRLWERRTLDKYEKAGKQPPKNWRDRYPEPSPPKPPADGSPLPPLPEGWCWASLVQAGHLQRGRSRHRPRDAAHLYGGPYPFIQTGDIRKANLIVRSHTQAYSEAGLAQSQLWPAGTLCITIAANIAETAMLGYDACFPDSIVGYHGVPAIVNTEYVMYFVKSVRDDLDRFAPATAQKNINDEILSQVPMPVPPPAEQFAIVEAVNEKLSQIDALESEVERGLARASRLRQAILKAAFEGRLVPQDPKDEPASVLLERIRAEAAKAESKPKPKARKKSSRKAAAR